MNEDRPRVALDWSGTATACHHNADWRNVAAMLLPFPHSWPVRCAKCGHTGTVTAATADLAAKPLRCRSRGHRQPFAPETIARARRRPTGRRASQQAAALIGRLNRWLWL
jgi:hypothetical protein